MSDIENDPNSSKPKKESIVYSDVHFEPAKSARAKCAECCITIEKGELKISKEVNSQNGKVIKSFHPKCALHVETCDNNRSKCQSCKEKISIGQTRVKVGSSCIKGPGTKHHYDCIFDKGANDGFEKHMRAILDSKKNGDSNETTEALFEKVEPKVVTNKSPTKKQTTPKSKKRAAPVVEEEDEDDDDDEDDEDESGDDDEESEADDDDNDEKPRKKAKPGKALRPEDSPVRKSSRARATVSYKDNSEEYEEET